MKLKSRCILQVQPDFSLDYCSYLNLLYYPLIGKDALIVYQILISASHKRMDWLLENLIQMTGISENRFQRSIITLEQFSLVRSFEDSVDQSYLYKLYPPKTAHDFLNHDTFGRLFLQKMGSSYYDRIKVLFSMDDSVDEGMEETTHPMDVSMLDQWSQEQEEKLQELRPKQEKYKTSFDFSVFLKGMDRLFPLRLRTPENLERIAKLADVHGISEKDMRYYVQRSINPSTKILNFETLKNLVYQNRKTQSAKDPYTLAPVQFLRWKQGGIPVANADKKLIESITENYGLPTEVVNVLIEYSLDKTNQTFSRSFVEKVAASWARLHIESKEQAIMQTKENKLQAKNIQKVPDWYAQTDIEKPDDDLLKQALERQKRLKEAQ